MSADNLGSHLYRRKKSYEQPSTEVVFFVADDSILYVGVYRRGHKLVLKVNSNGKLLSIVAGSNSISCLVKETS